MRYRVSPKNRTNEALSVGAPIYSVSLGLKSEREIDIIEGYKWVLEKFPRALVYIGDSPLIEMSLRMQGILPEAAARHGAAIAGNMVMKLREAGGDSDFIFASEKNRDPLFQEKLEQVRLGYKTDGVLQAGVLRDAEKYVERLERRARLGLPSPDAVLLSTEYIIFEIALYAHLAEIGYFVDVYVGDELWTLRQFLYGRIGGFPELTKRMFISLKRESKRV